jgi:hypothetical protein
MAVISGSFISTNGLVLHIDAANKKSNFLNTTNLIDFTTWTAGNNTLPWPANGDGTQNTFLYDTDPWGNSSLVLKTTPNNANANGGWEGPAPGYWVTANRNKKYRSCVWVRRISANTAGTFYHGLHTDGSGDVIQSDGSTNGNPYWACQGIGYMTQNVWYLHVGHIFPYNSTPAIDPTSGYWTRSGGWLSFPGCNITGYDPRFPADATSLRNRVYQYYAASDANSNLEFLYPRIDCIDGTEPSITDILNYSPAVSYDISGNKNNGTRANGLTYSGGGYVFNGTSNSITVPFNSSLFTFNSEQTIVIWMKNQSPLSARRNPYNQAYAGAGTITHENDTAFNYYYGTGGGDNSPYTAHTSPFSVTVGETAQICITRNSTQTSWYKNGTFGNSQSNPYGAGVVTGTNNITIGSGYAGYFGGNIYSLQLYNQALSSSEVLQNFNAIRSRYGL